MYNDLNNDLHLDDDSCYTWPIGGDDVVVQWDLMAKDGIITEEQAARMKAADKADAIASLSRRRPSRMTEVNRLKFVRSLSMHGLTQADLKAPRPNRGFAQRLIDYAQPAG